MLWHEITRTKDGALRHPANSAALKAFDVSYIDFSIDPCNVRSTLSLTVLNRLDMGGSQNMAN